MGRLPRAVDSGLVYHAINRGNNRGLIFGDDDDCRAFLESIAKSKERYPFRLFGYCLMSNHFHLLLRPDEGQSISRIVQSITVSHTWRSHKRHQTTGHVWQGRFKSPVIQDGDNLLVVLRYIEANPLRAKIVADPGDYRWSSYQRHGLGKDDPLLSSFPEWEGLGRTEAERSKRWRVKVKGAQDEDQLAAIRGSLLGGRPFGSPEWIKETSKNLDIDPAPRPRGRPPRAKK